MGTKACICLIPLLAWTIIPGSTARHREQDDRQVLGLALSPAPLVRRRIPLPQALGEVGSALRGGYALFGVELRLRGGRVPTVSLNLQAGSGLGGALRQILAQVPGYKFEVVSLHLVNIYPVGAKDDAEDLLNLRVPRFDVAGVRQGFILSHPLGFIPELKARIEPISPSLEVGSVLSPSGPTITVHLRNVTVRQILNAVSEPTESLAASSAPLGWISTFSPDPKLPAGGKYSWGALPSTPHDWKKWAEAPGPRH